MERLDLGLRPGHPDRHEGLIGDLTVVLRLATHAMGTRFELVLAGDDPVGLRAAGEEALREIDEADGRLSLFRRDSMLAHINRTAHLSAVRLDLDTFELLSTADEVARSNSDFHQSVRENQRVFLEGSISDAIVSTFERDGFGGSLRLAKDDFVNFN